mgnify:FL=1|jgi:hypothetical protein
MIYIIACQIVVIIILISRLAAQQKHIKEIEYEDQERRHREILEAIKKLNK